MRFYNIIITPVEGAPITFSTIGLTSPDNYSALQVELDIYEGVQHSLAKQGGTLKIKGIDYYDISTLNLNPLTTTGAEYLFASIQIFVGMSAGLPYAKPQQIGMILNGSIQRAFANWQGNQVSLDIVLNGLPSKDYIKRNIVWSWELGQDMFSAIELALTTAYALPVLGEISPDLICQSPDNGRYDTITAFSQMIKRQSKAVSVNPLYSGVNIVEDIYGFTVYDSTTVSQTIKLINYEDMIGNATWIDGATIQIKLVMRGDLALNQYIKLPDRALALATSALNPLGYYKNSIPFDFGVLSIGEIHHMGNSRQADANSWVTVLNCYVVTGEQISDYLNTAIQ